MPLPEDDPEPDPPPDPLVRVVGVVGRTGCVVVGVDVGLVAEEAGGVLELVGLAWVVAGF